MTQKFRPALPHRIWRSLPPTLRRSALAHATAWLAAKPAAARSAPGIAIVGELGQPTGLGRTARLMAAAARHLDIPAWQIDLPPLAAPQRATEIPPDLPPGVPLVLHVNAPMLPLALLRLPARLTRDRPVIGYWAWEVPDVPPEWHPAISCVSAVWTPSGFTAAALEPHLPGRVRVVPPAVAVAPPVPSALARAAFDLPEDAVVVLVSFNLASSFARKNPFAAVAAFRTAFGDRPDRILVLKIAQADHAPADLVRIAQLAHAPNIRIETRILPEADSHALTACADIVLSLHRAEGFGLVLAEAMLLGKPVVATGWSGNTDFMDTDSAALVGYRLIEARDSRAVYRGLWAEPDLADAVAHLRRLADDPAARLALGRRAREAAAATLGAKPLSDALEALA